MFRVFTSRFWTFDRLDALSSLFLPLFSVFFLYLGVVGLFDSLGVLEALILVFTLGVLNRLFISRVIWYDLRFRLELLRYLYPVSLYLGLLLGNFVHGYYSLGVILLSVLISVFNYILHKFVLGF